MADENRSAPEQLSLARHIAQEIGVPEATVLEAYAQEYERLSASAQITQFLEVITVKRVKDALRSRGSNSG